MDPLSEMSNVIDVSRFYGLEQPKGCSNDMDDQVIFFN